MLAFFALDFPVKASLSLQALLLWTAFSLWAFSSQGNVHLLSVALVDLVTWRVILIEALVLLGSWSSAHSKIFWPSLTSYSVSGLFVPSPVVPLLVQRRLPANHCECSPRKRTRTYNVSVQDSQMSIKLDSLSKKCLYYLLCYPTLGPEHWSHGQLLLDFILLHQEQDFLGFSRINSCISIHI